MSSQYRLRLEPRPDLLLVGNHHRRRDSVDLRAAILQRARREPWRRRRRKRREQFGKQWLALDCRCCTPAGVGSLCRQKRQADAVVASVLRAIQACWCAKDGGSRMLEYGRLVERKRRLKRWLLHHARLLLATHAALDPSLTTSVSRS